MPTNQKYSARIHSRRQLVRASEHVRDTSMILCDIGSRYETVLPTVSQACEQLNDMLVMCDALIHDIREGI